uniref:Alpha-type protein kinase domain-containing protein n=1 Tax=Amphimedon queenslandica TaxID=400682 RepID=A0A1X7UR18_AMPQE
MHIADAPCHGTQYHSGDDTYPNGDPAGITHESMMAEVVRLDIQYWFAYINRSSTDKMIDIFNESLKSQSSQRLIIRQVDATKPDELTSAVHKAVTASVFANEARKKIGGMSSTLDSSEPNWASLLPQPAHLETLEFLPVDVAKMDDGTLYVLQVFVSGKFKKYNMKNGIVCLNLPGSDVMQAFSHFSYVHSGESLLICDLEGIKTGNRFQLTDPAIHNRTRPNYYGSTDSGFIGIKRFFKSHSCNGICRQMGLEGIKA